MKRAPFLLFLATACSSDGTATPDAPPSERRLVLLHTNDEHSHLFAYGPEVDDFKNATAAPGALVGGAARRATVLKQLRDAAAADHLDTLTLSAGDLTQGTLAAAAFTSTSPDLAVAKKLGYDVITPGNHEFDQGPKGYAAAITAALAHGGVPQIVSSNIKLNGVAELEALYGDGGSTQPIKRYHVVTTPSGIKVGFAGVMGTEASYYAPLKRPVAFSGTLANEDSGDFAANRAALASELQGVVDTLRTTEKVDVVVVLSHGGVNRVDPTLGDDHELAAHVRGIDVIIGGHSHDALEAPIEVADPDGHIVPIVQAGAYGGWVGRIELVLSPGARPSYDKDPAKTRLVRVDNGVTAMADTVAEILDGLIADLESRRPTGGQSFLEAALSRVENRAVTDDASRRGDLYFRALATTAFDVVGLRSSVETNVLNLMTDSMLATVDALNLTTELAIEAGGATRADIRKGTTGELTFADLYRPYPLGLDPTDGTLGYPLVRLYIPLAAVKAAFEIAASAGLKRSDYYLVPSGLRVEYDTSRPEQDRTNATDALKPGNGRVTKISIDRNHADGYENPSDILFDLSKGDAAWSGSPLALHPVVTSLYVASFAKSNGVTLYDQNYVEHDPEYFILHRADGSSIKEYEAFIGYIKREADANGGKLPSRYDEKAAEGHLPRRMVCTGPLCGGH